MAKITLGKGAVKAIHNVIDDLFDRLKARVLGGEYGHKQIKIGITLPDLFKQASVEERNKPNQSLMDSLTRNAEGYIDAQRIAARTKTVQSVESFLRENEDSEEPMSLEEELGGQLHEILQTAEDGVKRIVDTEATHVRNQGTLDGIVKINAATGVDDPTVFFIVVRDGELCEECRRLHLLENGITPRLWRLSQVGYGYHKKGQDIPNIGGLHPHCRCSLGTLLPGYGFDGKGMVTYIDQDHDEYAKQNE